MLKHNINLKNGAKQSSQSFRNKGSYPGCAGCELRRRRTKNRACSSFSEATPAGSSLGATLRKLDSSGMQLARNEQRHTRACLRNYGWILAILAVFSSFSYLTFIPEQAFAVDEIVDPNEHRSLSQINTMQEMSKQICINSRNEESKQLEDTRDGKKYWATKLADGNCWMTQNLAYDGKKKDGSTENIGTSCTLSRTENNDAINGATCSSGSWTDSTSDKYFAIGKHEDGKHESQGNYYNWLAATQGGSDNGAQGVCPLNWQLPTSSSNNTKSFGGLIAAYGVNSDASGSTKLRSKPLFFQYGGNVLNGQLYNAGSDGRYWSSTPNGTSDAYHLLLYGSGVNPSGNNGRGIGYSVRCLAEGGWLDSYPELSGEDQANVAITVSPVISIDVTKDANDMTVDFTKVATSTIIARVGSNQPYQVLLSTDKSNLTNPDTDKTIPMIPSDRTIVKGTSNWGIKKLSSPTDTEVNENTIYSPVGINGNKALFYTSDSAASEDLTFPVAIAVDSSLPSGQYSTQVTLTAVAM